MNLRTILMCALLAAPGCYESFDGEVLDETEGTTDEMSLMESSGDDMDESGSEDPDDTMEDTESSGDDDDDATGSTGSSAGDDDDDATGSTGSGEETGATGETGSMGDDDDDATGDSDSDGGCENTTISGDVDIGSPFDLDELQGVATIDGSLMIDNVLGISDLSALECLQFVNQMLVVKSTPLQSVDLPNLRSSGYFSIYTNSSLASINVPLLESAIITINGNPLLPSADFPSLKTTSSQFTISDNEILTGITAPLLEDLPVGANLLDLPMLGSLNLTGVKTAAWGISVENTALQNLLGLSSLETVATEAGTLRIVGNPNLLSLDGLQKITVSGGGITIDSNTSLTSIDAIHPSASGSLSASTGNIHFWGNSSLSQCVIDDFFTAMQAIGWPESGTTLGNLACGGTCNGPICE